MVRITLNLSDDQNAILEEMMQREGYISPTKAFQSFLRHWGISQQPHSLTGKWQGLKGPKLDQIDADILKLVRSGKAKKGAWIKALIYDVIMAILGPGAKSPRVDEVLEKLSDAAVEKLRRD